MLECVFHFSQSGHPQFKLLVRRNNLPILQALSLPDAHETVEIAKTIREVARPIPTIELSITPSGPLVECEDVILSWANDTISKDVALTYNVYCKFLFLFNFFISFTDHMMSSM